MCGIAGIYTPGRAIDRDKLVDMMSALRHRGPDASGIWLDHDIGLVHTRLKIVDLSDRAAQPMRSSSGAITVTYNGEIYNHRALRGALESKGVTFRSTSDTEVLVEGLALFGTNMLERIEGMFAFAAWDREKRALLLCRDRAGEKPLYYSLLPGGGVVFASEIKAILAVERDIERDLSRIPEFLLYGYVPHPNTFYRGIQCLEPASLLECGRDRVGEPRSYWSPCFRPSTRPPSYAEAKEELRHRLRAIVRDRFAADVPVGAFLSGGLDSATVVGVATRDLGLSVNTFSIGFREPEWDESSDAKLSARHLGSRHREFIVTAEDAPSAEQLIEFFDEPFGDASQIPTYLVSKMARQHVTVVLTGDGGDEVFGGYPRFIGGALTEHVPRPLGAFARRTLDRVHGHVPRRIGATVARLGRLAGSTELTLSRRFLKWSSTFTLDELARLLTRDLQLDVENATTFSDRIFDATAGWSPLARMLDNNYRTYLPCDLLAKVDRCSMAVALETRCPLLDSGLIDFVGRMPDAYKVHRLTTKRILRDTFNDLFAPELLRRPKRGFGIPLAKWIKGPMRSAVEGTLRAQSARIYQFVDRGMVERLLLDAGPWRQAHASQVWTLHLLETWLQKPITGPRAARPPFAGELRSVMPS